MTALAFVVGFCLGVLTMVYVVYVRWMPHWEKYRNECIKQAYECGQLDASASHISPSSGRK